MSEAIPQEIKKQLDAMRVKYTDAYVGIAKCGCCLAVSIFDPTDMRGSRNASRSATEWLQDGLEVKRVTARESRSMIVATCPHGSQNSSEPDLFDKVSSGETKQGEAG